MNTTTTKMMTVTEAADVLQIPRHEIRNLIELGWFTRVLHNRMAENSKRLIHPDEIEYAKRVMETVKGSDRQLAAMKTYRRKMGRM